MTLFGPVDTYMTRCGVVGTYEGETGTHTTPSYRKDGGSIFLLNVRAVMPRHTPSRPEISKPPKKNVLCKLGLTNSIQFTRQL